MSLLYSWICSVKKCTTCSDASIYTRLYMGLFQCQHLIEHNVIMMCRHCSIMHVNLHRRNMVFNLLNTGVCVKYLYFYAYTETFPNDCIKKKETFPYFNNLRVTNRTLNLGILFQIMCGENISSLARTTKSIKYCLSATPIAGMLSKVV